MNTTDQTIELETTNTNPQDANLFSEDEKYRIVSADPKDIALRPAFMKFSALIASLVILPSALMILIFGNSAFTLFIVLPWIFACLSWLAGGTARMAAIYMDSNTKETATDGFSLIKSRWISLCFGYIAFVMSLMIAISVILWLINLLSGSSNLIGALLTIPVLLFVLASASIVINTYMYCAVVGYEDKNMLQSMKILIRLCVKTPFQLMNSAFGIFKTLLPTAVLSGILLIAGLAVTIMLTGFTSIDNFTSSLSGFSGSVRFASIFLILYLWVAYLISVVTISYALTFRDMS